MTDKIEPTMSNELKLFEDPTEYYVYRPDVTPSLLAMGVHPQGYPFDIVTFDGKSFYSINGSLWLKGYTQVDEKGIFTVFYRHRGEFKG